MSVNVKKDVDMDGNSINNVSGISPNYHFADGYPDLISAISACNPYDTLILEKAHDYQINQEIIINKPIKILGNNSTIIQNAASTNVITIEPPALKASTYATVDYAADEDYIAVNDVTGFEIGDLVELRNENDLYNPARLYYYKGGISKIKSIDATNNYLYLEESFPIDIPYASSAVGELEVTGYEPLYLEIKDLNITTNNDLSTTDRTTYGLTINHCVNPLLKNIWADNATHNIFVSYSYQPTCTNLKDGRSYYTGTGTSYGLTIYGNIGTKVEDSTLTNGRHGITISGRIPSYHTVIENSTIGHKEGTSSTGFNSHGSTHNVTVRNCMIKNGFDLNGQVKIIDSEIKKDNTLLALGSIRGREVAWKANYTFENCNIEANYIYHENRTQEDLTTIAPKIEKIEFKNCGSLQRKNTNKLYLRLRSQNQDSTRPKGEINKVEIIDSGLNMFYTSDNIDNILLKGVVGKDNDSSSIVQINEGDGYGTIDNIQIKDSEIPRRYKFIQLYQVNKVLLEKTIFYSVGVLHDEIVIDDANADIIVKDIDMSDFNYGVVWTALNLYAYRSNIVWDIDSVTNKYYGVLKAPNTYSPINVTADRAFDADATTVAELADIVGTLISDLNLD